MRSARGSASSSAPTGATPSAETRRLRVSGVLRCVDDGEVLADVDLELPAVARLDMRLVRSVRVAVGLGAHDRGARVLREHGRLDLALGRAGQRRLAPAGSVVTAASVATAAAAL